MREKYESLSAGQLREVAKARGLKGISALRKEELVQRMLDEDAKEQENRLKIKKQNLDSWTVASRQMVFWKCSRTVMDLSAAIITCRVKMMCMYPLLRFAASI